MESATKSTFAISHSLLDSLLPRLLHYRDSSSCCLMSQGSSLVTMKQVTAPAGKANRGCDPPGSLSSHRLYFSLILTQMPLGDIEINKKVPRNRVGNNSGNLYLLQVYKRIHVEIQIHPLTTTYAGLSPLSNSVSCYCKVESKKLLVICKQSHKTKISSFWCHFGNYLINSRQNEPVNRYRGMFDLHLQTFKMQFLTAINSNTYFISRHTRL